MKASLHSKRTRKRRFWFCFLMFLVCPVMSLVNLGRTRVVWLQRTIKVQLDSKIVVEMSHQSRAALKSEFCSRKFCVYSKVKNFAVLFFIDVQCYNVSIRLSEDMYKRSWHSKTTWTSWVSSIRDRRRERSGLPLSPELSPLPWRPHVCGRSFSRIIWFDNDLISFLSSFVFYFLCSFLESFTALVILLRSRESKPGFSVCKRSTEHWEVSWVSWIVNWLSWVAATSSWTSLWTATTGPASLGKRPFLQRTADC